MRAVAFLVLILGLGLAGGGAYYVFAQVQAAEARMKSEPVEVIPTIDIAVAKANLKFGQPLTRDDVKMVRWPAAHAPENAFRALDDVIAEGGAPRTVLRRMEANEPILKAKITGFGQKATVAALLDPGMRAHTLPVDAVNSVGGFLLPGARIDLYLTMPDRERGPTVRLLIQNLEVIAVDQDTDPDRIEARIAKTVTVQGTPAQVRELTLASTLGAISIALRGFDSEILAAAEPLDRRALLGEPEEAEAAEAPPEEAPEQIVVRVRRAGEVEEKAVQ